MTQIADHIHSVKQDLGADQATEHAGRVFWMSLVGRVRQAISAEQQSSLLEGTSLYDAPTPWRYRLWHYENTNSLQEARIPDQMFVTRALQADDNDGVRLVSGLPDDVLIELRHGQVLGELQDIIRCGMSQIDMASPTALMDVTETVGKNLTSAFIRHASDLADLSRSRKLFGLKITGFTAAAAITIAGSVTGNAPLSVLSGLAGLLGLPSVKELSKDGKELAVKSRRLKQSATGILFKRIGRTR